MAKFKKTGPTPANAVLANGDANASRKGSGVAGEKSSPDDDDEAVDKTPIRGDEAGGGVSAKDDDFGGFDEEEDKEYMERAKRNAMRRRGLDPKALDWKPDQGTRRRVKGQGKGEKTTK